MALLVRASVLAPSLVLVAFSLSDAMAAGCGASRRSAAPEGWGEVRAVQLAILPGPAGVAVAEDSRLLRG